MQMSDHSQAASMLELAQQVEELRNQMPPKPVTEITREDFFKLPPGEQFELVRRRVRIFDGAPPARPKPAAGSVPRAEFDSWGADKRHGHIKAGRAVHDVD
jgi:hypothetical protein